MAWRASCAVSCNTSAPAKPAPQRRNAPAAKLRSIAGRRTDKGVDWGVLRADALERDMGFNLRDDARNGRLATDGRSPGSRVIGGPLPSRTKPSSGVSDSRLPAGAPRRSTVAGSAAIRALGLSRPFAFPLSLPARGARQDHPRARIDGAAALSIDPEAGRDDPPDRLVRSVAQMLQEGAAVEPKASSRACSARSGSGRLAIKGCAVYASVSFIKVLSAVVTSALTVRFRPARFAS